MAELAYIRPTEESTRQEQIDAIGSYDKLFEDKPLEDDPNRTQLHALLDAVEAGDTVKVASATILGTSEDDFTGVTVLIGEKGAAIDLAKEKKLIHPSNAAEK